MRNRTRSLASTSVLITMIGAILLAGKPERSSAQISGFELYYLNFHCGDPSLLTKSFGYRVTEGGTQGRPLMGTHAECVGNCGNTGTVTLATALAKLPAGVSARLKEQVDKHQADAATGKGDLLTCLGNDKEPPSEKKCDNVLPPWFDSGKKCKDSQSLKTSVEEGVVYLEMCGRPVFAYDTKSTDSVYINAYQTALIEFVAGRVGSSTVCCDGFADATGPGSPCGRFDLDCDGTLNPSDRTGDDGMYPDIDMYAVASGLSHSDLNPFPPWFSLDDPNSRPPAGLCACKWELTKGVRTCSPDGKQPHVYQASWTCPSSGNKKSTRGTAPATEPCTPPAGRGNSGGNAFWLNRRPTADNIWTTYSLGSNSSPVEMSSERPDKGE